MPCPRIRTLHAQFRTFSTNTWQWEVERGIGKDFDVGRYQVLVCEGVFAHLRHKGLLKPKHQGLGTRMQRTGKVVKAAVALAFGVKLALIAGRRVLRLLPSSS
eukprot:scaffold3307_cov371-Prasinococcus_capsulatus_cf.AAC.6